MRFCWRLNSAGVLNSVSDQIENLQNCQTTPKQKPRRRGGGLRHINTSRKVPFLDGDILHCLQCLLSFYGSRLDLQSAGAEQGASILYFFWNFNRNHMENDRYWQKNNFLLFAKCLKMYSFFRICILRLQKVLI